MILLNRPTPHPTIRSAAAELKQADPALYATVERQYKARGDYSGMRRKRLISELCGEQFGGGTKRVDAVDPNDVVLRLSPNTCPS